MHTLATLFWNTHERRLRAGWRLLFTFGLLLVAALVMFFIGNLLLVVTVPLRATIGALTVLVAITAVVWLAGRVLDRRPFAAFGLRLGPRWWADFAFGLVLGALLMLGIFLVEWAAGWISVRATFEAPAGQPFALAILPPLIVYLCVGFYEELLTRGYLLRNLAEGLRIGPLGARGALLLAWFVSSAVFGLLHAGNPNASAISTLNIALAGLFLGLGYILTGELAVPIGVHITWNFFQGNVFGFPVSGGGFGSARLFAIEQGGPELWTGGAFGPEAGLLGLAAMLLGSALTVLWVALTRGSVRLHTALTVPPTPAAPTPASA